LVVTILEYCETQDDALRLLNEQTLSTYRRTEPPGQSCFDLAVKFKSKWVLAHPYSQFLSKKRGFEPTELEEVLNRFGQGKVGYLWQGVVYLVLLVLMVVLSFGYYFSPMRRWVKRELSCAQFKMISYNCWTVALLGLLLYSAFQPRPRDRFEHSVHPPPTSPTSARRKSPSTSGVCP